MNTDLLPAETYMAVSTFSGQDEGQDRYMDALCLPLSVSSEKNELQSCLSQLDAVTSDRTRDTGATIRDAAMNLARNKNAAGVILYLVTAKHEPRINGLRIQNG